ncbi:MAG: HAD family hydrolase [Leptolyngbya sp. SIO4C1]|nr:HAD family hydrolase [Leptolyngbya sp. SIO4C1]
MITPDILAFDFDGVICDGLIEYFKTAWRTYCQLYQPDQTEPPNGLASRFYKLRPVIETGWEMPVMLQAILAGHSDEEIIADWPEMAKPLLAEAQLAPAAAANAVDSIRDSWIQSDLDNWLAQHRFYPGVLKALKSAIAAIPTYIVSTKEGRFIQKLLAQNNVEIDPAFILGKEVKRPKAETLARLLQKHPEASTLWFIEDRLKALQSVKAQPELESVALFLADWGYNLETDRHAASEDERIHLLSLEQIVQKFERWV